MPDQLQQLGRVLDQHLSAMCLACGFDLEEEQDYRLQIRVTPPVAGAKLSHDAGRLIGKAFPTRHPATADTLQAVVFVGIRPARGRGDGHFELELELPRPDDPSGANVAILCKLDVFAEGFHDPLGALDVHVLQAVAAALGSIGRAAILVHLETLDANHLWYSWGTPRPQSNPRRRAYWEGLGFSKIDLGGGAWLVRPCVLPDARQDL